ncbi:SapC family protein (plasmid) [Sulfitobacter sp. OXR-159]|uniref:SapC family protein n=1 Tax=Sulfitobacter sp. OXR-159 TaxID=3100174 RepID=UPI002AC8E6BD|nr:SapC family protein [Sulfitobacter sp. OXR-159]WPZ31652.1 SapC family protein [Sulfitobacter sp. OXR-159]
MFKSHVPLKFADHANLRVFETNDYSFAKGETLAPIVFDEMADIAREYPIVFPKNEGTLPGALLGLEPGENAYINDEGRWLATYIPAHIRRYPFMLGKAGQQEEGKQNFVVVLDPDAPHFKDPSGHQVFASDGKLTPHMENRFALLQAMQKRIPRTIELVQILENSGILIERTVTIKKADQSKEITGFRVVDEQALNELPDDTFLELRRKGVVPLIYAHLLSWANFRQGAIAGKYPDLMTKAGRGNVPFHFENDTIDFSKFT